MLRATPMRPLGKCLAFLAVFAVLSANSFAADYSKEERFTEPQSKVFAAARRAASRIGAEIEKHDDSTGTLTFANTRSFNESITAFRGVLAVRPEQRTGKTLVHLDISAVAWAQRSPYYNLRGNGLARRISRRFFGALREELGLCKKSLPPGHAERSEPTP